MPCPNELVANCTGDQAISVAVVTMPSLSPGRPASVSSPKPKFWTYS